MTTGLQCRKTQQAFDPEHVVRLFSQPRHVDVLTSNRDFYIGLVVNHKGYHSVSLYKDPSTPKVVVKGVHNVDEDHISNATFVEYLKYDLRKLREEFPDAHVELSIDSNVRDFTDFLIMEREDKDIVNVSITHAIHSNGHLVKAGVFVTGHLKMMLYKKIREILEEKELLVIDEKIYEEEPYSHGFWSTHSLEELRHQFNELQLAYLFTCAEDERLKVVNCGDLMSAFILAVFAFEHTERGVGAHVVIAEEVVQIPKASEIRENRII